MPNCITSSQTVTFSATVGGSLDVSFESNSTITVSFKLLDATGGGVDVTGISCTPSGPSTGINTSTSPHEGWVTFLEASHNNNEYSIELGHASQERLGMLGPSTTVIVTTKPTC